MHHRSWSLPLASTLLACSFFATAEMVRGEERLEARAIVAPLLTGSRNPLLALTIHLEEKRTIKRILAQSSATDLRLDGPTGDPTTELVVGSHRLELSGRLAADADLLAPIELDFDGVEFGDGTILRAPLQHRFLAGHAIHRQGEHDCHTTRIPAIARTNAGTLLAVYDMRYNSAKDLQEHIDIGLSRSTDGGQSWEAPRPIMDMGEFGGKPQKENGCSDPNILVDPSTGRIFVSAIWTHGKPGTHQWRGDGSEPGFDIDHSSQFMMVTSDDDGKTWSQPENWTRRLKREEWYLFAPAPGNGIAMRDGTLVLPTQGRDAEGHPFSNITWSRDGGRTWTVSKPARHDTTECAVVELADGSLMLNMRDNRNRTDKGASNGRAISVTSDLGTTWARHPSDHAALPEPTCMASLISTGEVLLFSNPRDRHQRRHITIQASLDQGETWPAKNRRLLDEGRGKGYSSLVAIDGETIGILYESSRAKLVFQKLPLATLIR